MSSRLDRLFLLLETGSSSVTRKAAAIQLGEVQKMHPHELHNLLAKVRLYLQSNSWDTRIAAGQAVDAIISNVPQWKPPGIPCKKEVEEMEVDDSCGSVGRMKFAKFDIHRVLQYGSNLLASEGKEFDDESSARGLDSKDVLVKQRQVLNKRLGLDMAEKLGLDTSEIFSNEDLNLKNAVTLEKLQNENKKALSEVFDSEMATSASLSYSREMKAKRRARLYAKQRSKDANYSNQSKDLEDVPASKKIRGVSSSVYEQASDDGTVVDNSSDDTFFEEQSKTWPLESFCDQLMNDLFSPLWEVRHGAATAIREIIRVHGKGAGKTTDTPADKMELMNRLWMEDVALRLLCVLALDKFGDYISDQVVAPVRETCAQALGAMLNQMHDNGAKDVLEILLQLLQRPEWEARHGGLLGIKYLLAVREDLRDKLMPTVFEPLFKGLQDRVDDVSAVAAAALVPVTDALVQMLPEKVPPVILLLWDMLLELDDLTASTSSILMLLASLLSYPVSTGCVSMYQSLTELVPRLWPFLSHNSSVVRKAVLQTLVILTSNSNPHPCELWLSPLLSDALRLIYQRCMVENKDDIHDLLYKVWFQMVTRAPLTDLLNASCPFLSGWLCMLMHPSQVPIDPQLTTAWLEIRHKSKDKCLGRGRKSSSSDSTTKEVREQFYIGGPDGDQSENWEKNVIKARCMVARFLGLLSCYVTKLVPGLVYTPEMESPAECFARLLLFHLNSKSALQRMAVALVLTAWAKAEEDNPCPQSVKDKCLSCLNESIYFDEIAISFARMQQACSDFTALMRHHKLPLDSAVYYPGVILTLEQATLLLTSVFNTLVSSSKLKPKVLENLEDRRKSVYRSVIQTSQDQIAFSTTVQACLAAALVSLKCLPEKLNPVIRPLVESIKKEENEQLQKASAVSLVRLMELCISRQPCPNTKVIKNVTGFLCADPSFTPSALTSKPLQDLHETRNHNQQFSGILMLVNMQKCAEKVSLRRSNSITTKKNLSSSGSVTSDDSPNNEDENQKANELQRRGATFVFQEAASHFGSDLPEKLPNLWEATILPLTQIIDFNHFDGKRHTQNSTVAQELVTNLQVLEVTGPNVSPKLHPHLISLLPHVVCCLEHPFTAVRHMAARCLGTLGIILREETMDVVLMKLLGQVGASDSDIKRQGAIEGIACLIEQLGLKIIPYIVLLIVPMLGRMSDQNEAVRALASHCFASLIRLMPLEGGIQDPPNLRQELVEKKINERRFLEQLLDPKKLESFTIPVQINAELRSYQQEGVNWLWFLNKYKLHGILCDDMGLGKTLQSLCILAADHYNREKIYKERRSADCKPLPSLVICPPTLTGHWVYEVTKFLNERQLYPLHYTGPPAERIRLRHKARRHNLVVASYDIVRNDIDFFGSVHWNYCILDEGHIIKNGKTKLARAVKQLSANHRLILTGTPIQNNVLDLWSLFDFLMPGFLGTEKQFTARYSKPILQSRDAKSSSKEQEAGVLAMESLHRQVLPFLLCRMKEDVLKDLPPKIIQDYYCDLSSLQVQLYEDFAKSRARQTLEDNIVEEDSAVVCNTSHIFQALQYLRKVCNHPKLVLTPQHPEFERIAAQLKQQNSNLSDIGHAAKLCALRQLLLDCGIGTASASSSSEPEPAVNQHRALVFCQLKSMLDILETDLLKKEMPSVTFLRLDGTVPPGQRHSVVHRFNNDPSIDVLLLTTQVGGLGLNLTGADTVIFVEHDWNPMKDLQAMDRAHRIGQKKVVNVYRLITRGTLEEKIMGLQKFKLTIANTVISQENSSLQTMGTDQLLDLFLLGEGKKASNQQPTSRGGMKSALENLPELWDTDQYDNEYDVGHFMQSLKK